MTVPYTQDELTALVREMESDRVERKRSAADRSGIRRNLCAFANDLPGRGTPGVIFIGVEDDGRCAGLPIDDRLLRDLAGMKDDGNILPLPSIIVEPRRIDGCDVAVVTVQPSRDTPVRYMGRVWIKVGPTVREASPEEEQRLAERRRGRDQPFDLRQGASDSLDDLDLDFLRTHYLPSAIAPEVLAQNRRSFDRQLDSLRLLAGDRPTWGALLAFGRDPQRWVPGAWVQFLRIDGPAITDPIRDQKDLTGRLDDVLRRLDELFRLSVSVRTEVAGRPREVQHPDYPVAALQQLGWNAVMHRKLRGNARADPGLLVRRSHRNHESRRVVRPRDVREFRPGCDRLSQSPRGGNDAPPRFRPALRPRGAAGERCAPGQRESAAVVRLRADAGIGHLEAGRMKTVTFFNNKGGVGKTSLVYHLAWLFADLGVNVVAADLDPQANLTSMFLDDSRLEALWAEGDGRRTVYGAIQPLLDGSGDVTAPHVEHPTPGLGLVTGDLALSAAEDELSSQWPDCLDRKPRAFRVLSALWRVLRMAAEQTAARPGSRGRRPEPRGVQPRGAGRRGRRGGAVGAGSLLRCRACATSARRCGAGETSGTNGGSAIRWPPWTCPPVRCARSGTSSCNTRCAWIGP